MKLVRRDPFLHSFLSPLTLPDEEFFSSVSTSSGIDLYEDDGNVVVKAPVPGIPTENVDITYEDGVLTIQGKSTESSEEKDKNKVVYKSECASSFHYATSLPRSIDQNKIRAEVEDGVVTVTAPITEASKAKKIPVTKK